jgi:hypothetical protein
VAETLQRCEFVGCVVCIDIKSPIASTRTATGLVVVEEPSFTDTSSDAFAQTKGAVGATVR